MPRGAGAVTFAGAMLRRRRARRFWGVSVEGGIPRHRVPGCGGCAALRGWVCWLASSTTTVLREQSLAFEGPSG